MPEYDALVGLTDPVDLLIGLPRGEQLASALRRAAAFRPADRLSSVARIALQNDAWGLWQRVRLAPASSPSAHALEQGAEALVRRLAPARVDPWGGVLPPAVSAALGPGWRERESSMPSLQHERMHGLRRVFHVVLAGDGDEQRALYSTLVALDQQMRPVVTNIPGELETLRFEGERLVEAHVHELDRRGLSTGGEAEALVELQAVSHIPATGANRFYVAFEEPVPLTDLPCARCHEDSSMMSLPTPDFAVGDRWRTLFDLAEIPAAR